MVPGKCSSGIQEGDGLVKVDAQKDLLGAETILNLTVKTERRGVLSARTGMASKIP